MLAVWDEPGSAAALTRSCAMLPMCPGVFVPVLCYTASDARLPQRDRFCPLSQRQELCFKGQGQGDSRPAMMENLGRTRMH